MAKNFKRRFISLLGIAAIAFQVLSPLTHAASAVPSDVAKLVATPGDSTVTLSWDAATDDKAVKGYSVYAGLSPVAKEEGGYYTYGAVDAGNVTQYAYEGLSNDTTYYFAVTAYDDEGQESQYYSNEVSAKPTASQANDVSSPKVMSSSAITNSLIDLKFSEAVVLPKTSPATAFNIASVDNTPLKVLDAYVSTQDPSHVFVSTEAQTAGTQYVLTVGIAVTDKAGNPMVSGTSDTGVFSGSGVASAVVPGGTDTTTETDTVASADTDFAIDNVEVTSDTELTITFSKDVVDSPATAFLIEEKDNTLATVEILAVSPDKDDPKKVVLLTEGFEAGMDYVLTLSDSVTTVGRLSLPDSDEARKVDFTAPTLALADLIPPEDITAFLAKVVNETTVKLSWTASVDSAGDLAKYLIYTSTDKGLKFSDPITLAKELTSYDVSALTPGQTYLFKVTAVDENGNESAGVTSTVTLPEAGPEIFGLIGLSMMGGAWVTRRKMRA